jgi:hypothetical protein
VSKYTSRGQKLFRVALFEKQMPDNFIDIAWEIFPMLEAGNFITHMYAYIFKIIYGVQELKIAQPCVCAT